MKAQTLSVCLPGHACDKKCFYCVSKMTWAPAVNETIWMENIHKVAHFARMAQVTDVILTGKGEPVLNGRLLHAAEVFKDWPVVVQTNGKHLAQNLSEHPDTLGSFKHIDILAVSIDNPAQMDEYQPIWDATTNTRITSRITVMLTPEVCEVPFQAWVEKCCANGIRGLSFREVTIPNDCVDTSIALETANTIRKIIEGNKDSIKKWIENFVVSTASRPILRKLPYGAVIKDFGGVSVTKFDYCLQDSSGDEDIRSLVYNQDGHLYTSWSSSASIIF